MDWSTSDPTQTYCDTIFVPEPDHDAGVSILDDAGRDTDPDGPQYPYPTGVPYGHHTGRYGRTIRHNERGTPYNEFRARYASGMPPDAGYINGQKPVRPAGGPAVVPIGGRYTPAPVAARAAHPPREPWLRETYYTGGNIISENKNRERVFDTTWDEMPQHYNPNSGARWSQLVPDPRDRPYGGGPAPSLAFPMITSSEAMNRPGDSVFPTAPSPACGGRAEGFAVGDVQISLNRSLQIIKLVLLIIVAVLLALSLVANRRLERQLEALAAEAAAPVAESAPT